MINGREKVGADAFQLVIPLSKPKRLSLPFGSPEEEHRDKRDRQHEHNIREIPLANGGLGCALWDGGLVLTRWIYAHGDLFAGQRVLELGCGVGLAGIMAAHWASHVWLTDYIKETVRNAAHNVTLNGVPHDDEDETQDHVVSGAVYTWRILDRVDARVLDWDKVGGAADESNPAGAAEGLDANAMLCTAVEQRKTKFSQPWFQCVTCWPDDSSRGCCNVCATRCHGGHELVAHEPERFACDCFETDECQAEPAPKPIEPVDIIIGSELTYNLLSCATLARVVDTYLKPDGVFYEVLSNDRDGVVVFIEEIEKLGFTTAKHPAPPEIVGNYGTRKWSKQNEESFSLYTWRRRLDGNDDAGTATAYRFPEMQ